MIYYERDNISPISVMFFVVGMGLYLSAVCLQKRDIKGRIINVQSPTKLLEQRGQFFFFFFCYTLKTFGFDIKR